MRKFQRELFGATVTIVPTGTIVEIISRSQAFGSGGGYTRRTLFGEVALGEFIADASASNDFTVAR
ncbi:MAG: hypothetical protein Q8O94_02635, partial [bacterium]|nr:hypothetical protein [bacterium]